MTRNAITNVVGFEESRMRGGGDLASRAALSRFEPALGKRPVLDLAGSPREPLAMWKREARTVRYTVGVFPREVGSA